MRVSRAFHHRHLHRASVIFMSSVLGMSPRVVPCVVLIRGIRYVGTRPIPSQRHALALNATYLSRTPHMHIRPECHAPGSARGTVQRPVRMDGFDCRLCGHIGPHFIKSGLGADNLILGNRPWKKYEIGGGIGRHAPRRRGYFARPTYPISEPASVLRVSASPRAPC